MVVPELDVLQKYADEVAEKLNVDCQPVLTWLQENDELYEIGTHCHWEDSYGQKRGTICLDHAEMERDASNRGWQWSIAHEVCHLRERYCHPFSYHFAELMTQLGFSK